MTKVTKKDIEDFVDSQVIKPVPINSYPVLKKVRNKYVCYGIPEAIKVARERISALQVLGVDIHPDHL